MGQMACASHGVCKAGKTLSIASTSVVYLYNGIVAVILQPLGSLCNLLLRRAHHCRVDLCRESQRAECFAEVRRQRREVAEHERLARPWDVSENSVGGDSPDKLVWSSLVKVLLRYGT